MDEKIKYLCRFHNIKTKIERLTLEYEYYTEKSYSVPGPNYDKEVIDGTRSLEAPFIKWLEKAMDVETRIKELEMKKSKIEEETLNAINTLDNIDYRLVLQYRYLDWLTWEEIAHKMYYSRSTVKRYHNTSLELLNIEPL